MFQGAVLVDAEGRIAAVGPESVIPRPDDVPTLSFPTAVLLPGLVNVHTHLELTGFAGQVHDPGFFDWIQHVRRLKAGTTPEQFLEAACQGVRDAWAVGVTTLADTGDTGAAAAALTELGGRGVVYQEVFGPHPDQEPEALRGLVTAVERLRRSVSAAVEIGVSPHAPYTVSPVLYRSVAAWARAESLKVAVHLAESPEESAFIGAGTGPFAELWSRRGIPLPAPAASPVAHLDACGVLGPGVLVIHAVQTDAAARRRLRDAGISLALCPRSNRRHGHGSPPVREYARSGIRAGLGTDSAASVAGPDLFAEAREARLLGGLDAAATLRLMTLGGAEALGLAGDIGSIEPAKWADLCLVDVDVTRASPAELGERILTAGGASVAGTWVGGRRVYARANQ